MTVHIVADAVGPVHVRLPSDVSREREGVPYRPAEGVFSVFSDWRRGGAVQIEVEITEAEPVVSVRGPRGRHVLQRWVIDRRIDLKTMADERFPDRGV
jgi:hypothetical protein